MNTYEQASGRWYDDNWNLLGVGYAGGDQGHVPEGVNNPDMQEIAETGPLPRGFYTIGKPYDHPKCGMFYMPLTPNLANIMYGRGGFGVHGDLVTAIGRREASDGCIILARDVREAIWNAGDPDLQVVSGMLTVPDLDSEIAT